MDTPDQRGAAVVTVLRTLGPLLAKRWLADGTIRDYDDAAHFHVAAAEVPHLRGLYNLLQKLRTDPRRCIIRGVPRTSASPGDAPSRRNLLTFEDQPSHLFMVDVDGFDCMIEDPLANPVGAVAEYVAALPAPFQAANYAWQLSGSAGHPSKPSTRLRAHLWFWLTEPLTCADAEAWTRHHLAGLADATVHRTVQVNYTADPVMDEGACDPLAGLRIGWRHGRQGTLDLSALPLPEALRAVRRAGPRRQHVDPRGKLGIVGAVCRAFVPEEIALLWPDLFEAGRSPERITWRAGGGSVEGVRVTDDGLHLFNSHNSAPTGGYSANLFDFIRLHAFGHLDDGMDPDAAALDPTALPSYQATDAWARTQPEVIEQLALDRPEVQDAIIAARDRSAQAAQDGAADRAQRLAHVLHTIEGSPDLDHLENTVTRQGISRMLAAFNDTDRERIEDALQRRTREITGGKAITLKTIRKWLAHTDIDTAAAFVDRDPSGAPLDTLANFRAVLARHGITCRYNVITKAQEVAIAERNTSSDNFQRTVTSALYDLCRSAGLAISQNTVRGYVALLCDMNEYNPVADWITAQPWDGGDHIAALAQTITCREDFPLIARELYLRKWLIQAVACACASQPVQARGVLVLQGEQYIGKTRWLERLLRGALHKLVRTGHHLDPHNKDSVKTALSHWIVELGEIGGTMRRSDQDALKAFLSQTVDNLRLPYADAESIFRRRTVFVGSVNEGEFLSDPTGSTRYWVMPVVRLDHEHHVEMQQVFAQAYAAWAAGETHFMAVEEMATVQLNNKLFQVTDPITEALVRRFPFTEAQANPPDMRWIERTASEIAQLAQLDGQRFAAHIGRALHRISGATQHRTKTARLWRVPVYVNDTALHGPPD